MTLPPGNPWRTTTKLLAPSHRSRRAEARQEKRSRVDLGGKVHVVEALPATRDEERRAPSSGPFPPANPWRTITKLLDTSHRPRRAEVGRKTRRFSKRVQPEPVRDWSFGPLSEHRLWVTLYFAAGMVALYTLQLWLWPESRLPHTTIEYVLYWGSVLWLAPLLSALCALAGLLWFRHPKHLDAVESINKLVSWRIVSRGTNVEALSRTIHRCHAEMSKTPLFPYIVEVVTDRLDPAMPPQGENLRYFRVPDDYRTPNRSLYKARALHYATEHSPLPDDAWLVHLDEETHPTASGIRGVCAMIREEEASGALRIGQGAIVYHRKRREHPILTLADSIRTGDDFGRFYLQHKFGVTLFGLHGSYIVVRNDAEKSIGFDFGPEGSITEDAFWALVAMERGYRCRWVNGYMEEQSTESVGDFVRQRRRWYQGLAKVVLYAPVKLRWRLPLGINTFLWTFTPFGILYNVIQLFYGFKHAWWIILLASSSFVVFIVIYLIGLQANLHEHGVQGWFKRAGWFMAQLVLIPIFAALEGLGVLAAIFRPAAGFDVVKK